MKRYVLNTPPVYEPVILQDLKLFLKIDSDDEDTLLSSLLIAARQSCEQYTGISFITQKWECWLDFSFTDTILSYYPIQSIDEIKIFDTDNVSSIIDPSNYWLDKTSKKAIMKDTYSFPTIREQAGVQITYTTGFGLPCDVPENIKHAIMITAGALYDCKLAGNAQVPAVAKSLISQYRDIAKLGAYYSE